MWICDSTVDCEFVQLMNESLADVFAELTCVCYFSILIYVSFVRVLQPLL